MEDTSESKRRLVKDDEFDAIYEDCWRRRSLRFWSPAAVAQIAARWLTEGGIDTVLDVGSGVGKFCILGALSTTATFVGIEHRLRLVVAARRAAASLGVGSRCHFHHGEVDATLLHQHRAIYLFNPFAENLYDPSERLDSIVELDRARYDRDIALVEDALRRMPEGGRVVTYHGFGGRVPDSFDLVHSLPVGSDLLRLWVRSPRAALGHYAEIGSGIALMPLPYPDLPSE